MRNTTTKRTISPLEQVRRRRQAGTVAATPTKGQTDKKPIAKKAKPIKNRPPS